jgi:ribonuclease Z
MRRILFIAVIFFAAVIAAGAGALRLPAVEDALFERALSVGFAGRNQALFDDDELTVLFCGTGSPLPSAKRAQACTAVFAGGRFYLVDAGSGSWENLARRAITASRLGAVFLTHFHSDHIGDLGEVNLGSWVAGRQGPLPVYGGAGVERVIAGFNEAYAQDTAYRTAHHGKAIAPPRTAGMTARAIASESPAVVLEQDGLRVTAFAVDHDPVSPALGYRFDYKGRSVVISGDTAYSESLIDAARGADLIVHEAQANHMVARMQRAAAQAGAANLATILSDIPSYHTSPEEAARVAEEAGAAWLVLSHLTPAPDNAVAKRIFMRGVSAVRNKRVRVAEDGMVVSLPERGGFVFSKI